MKIKLLVIILTAILFISCNNKSDEDSTKQEIISLEKFGDGSFFISNPWARPGAINRNSAAFFSITNKMDQDDTLYSVESDVAKVVELHETYEKENDMMGMRHVDYIIIPARSTMNLKPGSFHVMLIGLNKNLSIGDTEKLTLLFKNSEKIDIPISVIK